MGSRVDQEFLVPTNSDGEILEAKIDGWGKVVSPSLAVFVFTIDPSTARSMPGTFLTGFAVVDTRFNQFQQPIDVSLRYRGRELLFATLMIPALLIGPAIIWAKGKAGGAKESYRQWRKKSLNVVAVFVGLGGARAYFGSRVLGSPNFGADLFDKSPFRWVLEEEWYLVAAGTVSAFVAAALSNSQELWIGFPE